MRSSQNKSQNNGNSLFTIVCLLYLLLSSLFCYFNIWFIASLATTFNQNFLVILWNIFISFMFLFAFTRIFIIPIWKVIFIDVNKLGQKIEWYDSSFKHLSPEKNYNTERFFLTLIFTLFIFTLRFLPFHFLKKWSLTVSNFKTYNGSALKIAQFYQHFFPYFDYIIPLIIYYWFFTWLEGRTRIFFRILEKKDNKIWSTKWKENLSENSFKNDSEKLDLSFFTSFIDKNGNSIKAISNNEEWELVSEKTLRANILCVGPVGSGKTEGYIKPSLDQIISWNSQCSHLKASISVYDPKGSMAQFIKELCIKHNREEDLILLSLENEHKINPINIKNIWRDDSAFKVTGWILAAWKNFQGKSSPEPYWENQNFILIRNLLVNLYVINGDNVSIFDISKKYDEAANGCFVENKENEKVLTLFGEEILKNKLISSFVDLDSTETYDYLKKYSFSEIQTNLNSIDEKIIQLTEERLQKEKNNFKDFSLKVHSSTNPKLISLKNEILDLMKEEEGELDEKIKTNSLQKLKSEYTQILEDLVDKDIKEKYKDKKTGVSDYRKTLLVEASKKLKEDFCGKFKNDEELISALSIVKDATDWLFDNWSIIIPENRGSIVSNVQPFLKMFETPKIKRILSPLESTVNFDHVVCEGKIIVPCFPSIDVGDSLSNAIITLVKSRWQHAVLENPQSKRIKLQVMDEYQRIATFAQDKSTGDLEFMELSREYGGCSILATQSISAIKQKAQKEADFNKIHGVIRSIIILPTNDPESINFMQKVSGKKEKKRISRTVQEGAQAPELENISEKYSAKNSSLSVSFTESEQLEDIIQSSDVQNGEAWTAIAILFDGEKTKIKKIALRPYYWIEKLNKWKMMKSKNFKLEL